MKHIFTIHSHITFLAALGAIEFENLDSKDTVLVCNSGYKPLLSSAFKGKARVGIDEAASERNIFSKLLPFSYSKSVSEYIDNLCEGDSYIAYIDLMSNFNKFLVFNQKCKAFNIIEEGIVNYGNFYDFNLLTTDLKSFSWSWNKNSHLIEMIQGAFRLYRGRSPRMQALPIHPNIYANFPTVKSYCFSELAFPQINENNKKVMNFNLMKYVDASTNHYPDGSWFWIGDTASKYYKISMDHFRSALEILLEKINPFKESRIIYLKFRGSESEEEKNITRELLEYYNFQIFYLEKEVILELAFATGKDFKVCGIGSSLLLYASNFGHKTFSALPYIPDVYNISIYESYPTIAKKVYYAQK